VVYYYLAEDSKAVPVRSPASWQLTGPFECRNYEQFLASEFPETAAKIAMHVPDEKSRRIGQAVAAASLPKLKK